ncbi:MAG: DNA repair protein RadA [Bdellovibrionales bacterium CG10_big_fil_rev_8_21_14_0_10_45_34]|nr:MAG: DNA repair protein RadA [Bdellovibrionales bacterium CG10_big_fil_rev_8_21_14_0_10_45_34]
MSKSRARSIFVCQNCGAQRPKWEGYCTDCKSWNSFVEEKLQKAAPDQGRGWVRPAVEDSPIALNSAIASAVSHAPCGIGELDRVLGGGFVASSLILLGGEPGIGKSTLVLQTAGALSSMGLKTLYISAEESPQQTALRAERLGIRSDLIEVASQSNLEKILEWASEKQPDLLIIDSIQTIFSPSLEAAPGSVSQVRDCAAQLLRWTKSSKASTWIIGHINKDGHIAGPKVLEHMVDTVLNFEGDPHQNYRILRAIKNRFGAAGEIGVFEMQGIGLVEVSNPSQIFLGESEVAQSGCSAFASMEGARPLVVEIQALSTFSPLNNPRRVSVGIETQRLHMICAVLEKHLRLQLYQRDVFVNVMGGLKISEPAADLAVAVAMLSSEAGKPLASRLCAIGEIGLTGEIRPVNQMEMRVKEALRLGFKALYLPHSSKERLKSALSTADSKKVRWLSSLKELHDIKSKVQKNSSKDDELAFNSP